MDTVFGYFTEAVKQQQINLATKYKKKHLTHTWA